MYDEADSLLCAGRLLSDGSVISMKYNGMGEKELFELLKSFLWYGLQADSAKRVVTATEKITGGKHYGII
ncbi:MAG TPA: hypothetical protein DHF18_06020 [Ruminococcaceae bacterium]|nr:hypothetical protein [Oscillospiraceae bacterium]